MRKSIYAVARERLATLRGPDAPIVFSLSGAEAALPLLHGEDAEALCEGAMRLICLGAPLALRAEEKSGHVLIYFSSGFYDAALGHIITNSAPAPMPRNAQEGPGYALCRMLMLARKSGTGCPDNAAVHRALRLAFAAEEAEGDRLRARLDEAASALISLARTVPLRERAGFLDTLGDVGRASSVLIYEGMIKLGLE